MINLIFVFHWLLCLVVRLTAEFVLLFRYFSVIRLFSAFDDRRKGARAAAILSLIGLGNLPIIHYSVSWRNTLHQGNLISLMSGKNAIDASKLLPLLFMANATRFWFAASLLARAPVEELEMESDKDWAQ